MKYFACKSSMQKSTVITTLSIKHSLLVQVVATTVAAATSHPSCFSALTIESNEMLLLLVPTTYSSQKWQSKQIKIWFDSSNYKRVNMYANIFILQNLHMYVCTYIQCTHLGAHTKQNIRQCQHFSISSCYTSTTSSVCIRVIWNSSKPYEFIYDWTYENI